MTRLNVAVVGMNFGKEFVKLYQHHLGVDSVAICRRDPAYLKSDGDELGIPETLRFTDFAEVVACDEIDAIHIVTPISTHADYTIRARRAGKHVACTVPMGLSIEELEEICAIRKERGLVYMMMETAVYTREFLYVKDLANKEVFFDQDTTYH